jgi:hypothetical protein
LSSNTITSVLVGIEGITIEEIDQEIGTRESRVVTLQAEIEQLERIRDLKQQTAPKAPRKPRKDKGQPKAKKAITEMSNEELDAFGASGKMN